MPDSASVPADVPLTFRSPAFVPDTAVMPPGAVGFVRSIFTVCVVLPELLPTASAPE